VNVLAIYVANEHILSLMEDAVTRNMAHRQPAGPGPRERLAAAAVGLRRLIGSPVATTPVLPKLGDNPYRG
jgi:hypothetical protein